MPELNLLRQFTAVAKLGSLSRAAEILHISQPALSRSMKKLEEELDAALFERRKNSIALNDTGKVVLELAVQLLQHADELKSQVAAFEKSRRTIFVGSCAPAPLWTLMPLLSREHPEKSLETTICGNSGTLLDGLRTGTYQVIVLPFDPGENSLACRCGEQESLFLSLPPGHRFAAREGIMMAEMDGENMLLFSPIGFWEEVHRRHMPHSHFLIQSSRFEFSELVEKSRLPSFVTDLSIKNFGRPSGRIIVPLLDDDASVTYHYVCNKADRQRFPALFS